MRAMLLALTVVSLPSCATTGSTVTDKPDLTLAIGEENVRIGERTFAIADTDAMRAGFAGACARGCRTAEIRAIPMARYDAMLAAYTAGLENDAAAMQLRIATTPPVPLVVGEAGSPSASCQAEVVLRHHAIDVYVNGEILAPDPDCETWGATVCDSGTQDPLKKAELAALVEIVRSYRPRFREATCLYAESEMPAMLIERLIAAIREHAPQTRFSLRRDRRPGRLPDSAVTEALVAQGQKLTACYDVELQDNPGQMSAVLRFLIGPDGRVVRAALREAHQTTPRFDACLIAAARTLEFPRPENGGVVDITYPLHFSPRP